MRVVWCSLFFAINVFAFDYVNVPTLEEPVVNDDRIVGGQEADIVHHPHQVGFILNGSYFCGGFIISENYIVTAAHCTLNVAPSSITLRAGSSYRQNGTIIPIAEVYTHPEYDNPEFDKDVGVLKTEYPINFTRTIQPIRLAPQGRRMRARTYFEVSGWGRTQEGGPLPDRLMEVVIPVVSYHQCFMSYPMQLTRNMFCGGNYVMGGQGTCQGDSGGTAVQDGLACGIVSFGRGCGRPMNPSVFANIAARPIREFIRNITNL
ncbi:trypsin 3A1 [Manduca sexta]|uniref:trypsin 3A1 n=1 Tax=Manduca sexta TaxID=7130 RepID=UPI00188FD817|nr:trypsin 3A1 [Manduca sexta]